MATKYIECRHDKQVRCKMKDGSVIDFYPRSINKYTGTLAHTGFTPVTEAQLKALETDSKLFASFVKSKLLIVRSDVPSDVQTPQALIADKDKTIATLQAENAALKASIEALTKNEPSAEEPAAEKPKKSKKDSGEDTPIQF